MQYMKYQGTEISHANQKILVTIENWVSISFLVEDSTENIDSKQVCTSKS